MKKESVVKFSSTEEEKIALKGDMRLVMEVSEALKEALKKEVTKRRNKMESSRDVILASVGTLYTNVVANILRVYIPPDKWDYFLSFCEQTMNESFKEARRIAKESLQ